jgi:type IV pilus assembly protein PilA
VQIPAKSVGVSQSIYGNTYLTGPKSEQQYSPLLTAHPGNPGYGENTMVHLLQSKARRDRRGFTLIELLVVVLILAVLMAVSIPLYLSAVADAQRKTCRANMQTIANAVQAARVKGNLGDYSTFIAAVSTTLEPDLSSVPTCPNAAAATNPYAIVAVGTGFKVTCTSSSAGVAHGSFQPGVDSN